MVAQCSESRFLRGLNNQGVFDVVRGVVYAERVGSERKGCLVLGFESEFVVLVPLERLGLKLR